MTDYRGDWPTDEELKQDHDGCLKVAGFVLMVFVLFWLAGCGEEKRIDSPASAPEMARQAQACYDNGLRAALLESGWGRQRIACLPHPEGCPHHK